jgi:hypothetical protein
MAKYLYRKCQQSKWFEEIEVEDQISDSGATTLGVVLKRPDGTYATEPASLSSSVVSVVDGLGAAVAFTMSSEITHALLQQLSPFQSELALDPRGLMLPIVSSLEDISSATSGVKKDSYICLCRQQKIVLVWGHSAQSILAHGSEVEGRLLSLVCMRLYRR